MSEKSDCKNFRAEAVLKNWGHQRVAAPSQAQFLGDLHAIFTFLFPLSDPMLRTLLFATVTIATAACTGQSAGTRASASTATDGADTLYRRGPRTPDGTGRYYLGREIAPSMSHSGAGWLERTEREQEERTDLLVQELGLRPGDVVADIGAGSGYLTFRIAPMVPRGSVLAVDIQPEMLAIIRDSAITKGITNVQTVQGNVDDPKLAAGCADLVLLVDAYHEFSHPHEMMTAIRRGLKRGGRVALVEYRAEDPAVAIKPLHKMTEAQARREMEAVGLRWVETRSSLPQQHLMFFEKE